MYDIVSEMKYIYTYIYTGHRSVKAVILWEVNAKGSYKEVVQHCTHWNVSSQNKTLQIQKLTPSPLPSKSNRASTHLKRIYIRVLKANLVWDFITFKGFFTFLINYQISKLLHLLHYNNHHGLTCF